MRVIAGEYRSRVLVAPKGMATRPTSDRLRETLFNVIGARVVDANFVDLFAGSGAVGIEAMSRGAASCTFIESARPAVFAIKTNLAALGIRAGVLVEARDVLKGLEGLLKRSEAADVVFLDPPYGDAEAYEETLKFLARNAEMLLADGALVIAEHARRTGLAERYGALERTRVLEQGDAGLSFYCVAGGA